MENAIRIFVLWIIKTTTENQYQELNPHLF
jgi:hypothetical protein